jgi:SAM-dependent methyltransferase
MGHTPNPSVVGGAGGAPFLPPEYYGAALEGAPVFKGLDHSPSTRLLREVLPRYVRAGMSVLDIGCGNAIGACHLAAAGATSVTYVGLDPDPDIAPSARAVLAHLPADRVSGRVLTQTVQDFAAAGHGPVDLIYCNWAFHCCLDPARPDDDAPLAALVARCLAPSGVLLLGDGFMEPGTSADEVERIKRYNMYLVAGRSHGNPYPAPEALAELFSAAGLAWLERRDVVALPLARYMRMAGFRYALQAFRAATVTT